MNINESNSRADTPLDAHASAQYKLFCFIIVILLVRHLEIKNKMLNFIYFIVLKVIYCSNDIILINKIRI